MVGVRTPMVRDKGRKGEIIKESKNANSNSETKSSIKHFMGKKM